MQEATGMPMAAREVTIPVAGARLAGNLVVPVDAVGLVIFAHGSGSGRFSPRNRFVAGVLQQGGIATLLMDLLEEREAQDHRNVFDIPLLARRVEEAMAWARQAAETSALPLGLFGASTGAAAALQAAAEQPAWVRAVVSRGGRPDLASPYLARVQAPTLLIVGGEDHVVLQLNQEAYEALHCPKELRVIPGATHLFEEPGALERVAELARDWFRRYLPAGMPPR